MFWMGMAGMPRRIATYLSGDGLTIPNLISSVGAAVLALGVVFWVVNLVTSLRYRRRPAGDDPWGGQTLEWATSSPPPPTNFDDDHPLPPVRSFAPLLDEREREEQAETAGADPGRRDAARGGR
jgi:cytochrome c oxidase subunit 1